MKPDEIDWSESLTSAVFWESGDLPEMVDHWRCLAIQEREESDRLRGYLHSRHSYWRDLYCEREKEIVKLEAKLAWTGDRLRERIRELEAEVERLKGHGEKWPFR